MPLNSGNKSIDMKKTTSYVNFHVVYKKIQNLPLLTPNVSMNVHAVIISSRIPEA